ncbi:TetR/AcrR family transcriptional regulator [Cystobacter fuscus]|uniref:TetR/AcrR family transcriptional regulator n=1 Tax=Cystobacter fuscus TaxID=43 RepID=UPI0005BD3DBB|nr:TetR/AcrR family transcriptional regulator [Cystobacter fuscus]
MQGKSTSPKKAPAARRGRGGRPSAEQAGEVDRRILEAATRLFLHLGFEATSCDEVAVQAGAGKASIYARYANKEELFTAVVRHSVGCMLAPSKDLPVGLTLRERLRTVGNGILAHALQPGVVALMRVVITTAYRLPELARLTDRIGRDRGIQLVAEAIAGPQSGTTAAIERALPAAAKFIDLVFVPHQMRALLGDDLDELAAKATHSIDEAIDLLSRGGWLNGWE